LKLKVFFPDRRGFYAVYYATPFKGAKYGWIPAENVGFSSGDSPDATAFKDSRKNSLSIGINYGSFSPSAFQQTLGENTSSISEVGFHFSYARDFSYRWFAELRFDYYSFTNSLLNSTTPSTSFYYANGDLFGLSLGYKFINKRKFVLAGMVGPGLAFSQAGDGQGQTSQGQTEYITPSNVYTNVFFTFKAEAAYNLGSAFAIYADLGYELNTVSSVALLNSSGASLTSTNLNLSTVLLDAGLRFRF
jgi:hypothetical protein